MSRILRERLTASLDGDFVVFLIGMRVNNPLKVHKWMPVFVAMPPMIKELDASSGDGFPPRRDVVWTHHDHDSILAIDGAACLPTQ